MPDSPRNISKIPHR